jgi:hypothetical protein
MKAIEGYQCVCKRRELDARFEKGIGENCNIAAAIGCAEFSMDNSLI